MLLTVPGPVADCFLTVVAPHFYPLKVSVEILLTEYLRLPFTRIWQQDRTRGYAW